MLMHNDDNRDGKFLSQVNYKRLEQELVVLLSSVAKFRRTAKMRISKFDALLPNDDGNEDSHNS